MTPNFDVVGKSPDMPVHLLDNMAQQIEDKSLAS